MLKLLDFLINLVEYEVRTNYRHVIKYDLGSSRQRSGKAESEKDSHSKTRGGKKKEINNQVFTQ